MFCVNKKCLIDARIRFIMKTFLLHIKGVQVVAVYIDNEVEAWKSASYPPAWLSVYAPEIDQQDLYDIKALPTLYLLNTQLRVLLKDIRLEKVINHLSSVSLR